MKIIRSYFLKEFSQNFLFSFLSITFIMLAGNMVKISDLVIRKGVNPLLALKLFSYFIPYLLEFSIPLACLLGILLSIGRISADNEIIALKVSGVALSRILMVFLTLGLCLSLFMVILNDRIIPQASFSSRKILKKMSENNPLGFIEPGVFIDQFKNFVLFTHDVERNTLKKVFIYETKDKSSSNLIYADKGEFVVDGNILKIRLLNGFVEGPGMKYRIQFKTHFMHLPIDKNNTKISRKPKDMSIKELSRLIKTFKQEGKDPIPLEVSLQKKLSYSFSSIVFILLGFGTAGVIRHREKSLNFGLCFLSALGYYLLSLAGETLVFKAGVPVFLGIWFPNLVFLLLGGYLSYKVCQR